MKAPFSLSWLATEKAVLMIALFSTASFWVYPEAALAASLPAQGQNSALVFEVKQTDLLFKPNLPQLTYKEVIKNDILAAKLKEFLVQRQSPLADYTEVLLAQPNWKKILSLANAESGLCRFYPEKYNNCWGVGGPGLWKMGNDLSEGVAAMNDFLANYPKNSSVKYADMSIDRMNGLYKQPRRPHWSVNNNVILQQLDTLELQAKAERLALFSPSPNQNPIVLAYNR